MGTHACTVSEVLRHLEALAPNSVAEDWDNVGLLVGDKKSPVTKAIVCIDLTSEAIELAEAQKCSLIVNHHPCIFPKGKGLSKLNSDSLVYQAIQKGISVVASHTNFDQCALEVIQSVSSGLGLKAKGRFHEKSRGDLLKLVTYVPETHLEAVRTEVSKAGAGHIGQYDQCAFFSKGEGTFRGGDLSNPFLGKPGKLERVEEVRFETIVPRGLKNRVIQALHSSHPYEEVAYDLYPVEQSLSSKGLVEGAGYGFWGEFTEPRPFSDVAKDVKSLFNIDGFWITHPIPSKVTKLGFVAGKGAAFLEAAVGIGCDLFITGEAGYHSALASMRRGMGVMELGHRESERFFVETMKNWLSRLGIETFVSTTPTQKIWQEV